MTHFKLSEFEHSATALFYHIDNTIPDNILPNIYNLVENLLDPLRDIIGEPIYINSGYRCDALNKKVGGAKTSQHRIGCAADITTRRNGSDASLMF